LIVAGLALASPIFITILELYLIFKEKSINFIIASIKETCPMAKIIGARPSWGI
jgi:hypothetical protein